MIYVFLGPSASGKDTQIKKLQKYVPLPNISTGQLLRDEMEAKTTEGKEAEKYMSKGVWAPDDLVLRILKKRISQKDCKTGFILNGFPRRISQVNLLDMIIVDRDEHLERVIHFDLDKEEVLKRFKTQIKDSPERIDKTKKAIENRYNEYIHTIKPILEEYQRRGILLRIDAAPSIPVIFKKLSKELNIPGVSKR